MNSEISTTPAGRPGVSHLLQKRFSHVVFDFDGTLSWLRHGWPEMMFGVFASYLPEGVNATSPGVRDDLFGIIMGLNGMPTIMQMRRFSEYAASLGRPELDPELLRQEFQRTLDGHILERSRSIQSSAVPDDAYVVAGARALLGALKEGGARLYILSSTVEHRVREEAELLGLAHFFEGRIFGSPLDPSGFTKRAVFERILEEDGVDGCRLLAFGDGPVEIAEAKRLGGTAVAVCTDEAVNGSGVCDPRKSEQLLGAGADVVVPDFNGVAAWAAPLIGSWAHGNELGTLDPSER
jgi:FMN phosphatase YigB (HAD superfamily)